jgi:hypothetical protein
MTIEIAAAVALAHAPSATAAAGAAGAPVQAGYGVSLTDFTQFQQALAQAGARLETQPVSVPTEAAKQLFKPLEHINNEAAQLSRDAQAAKSANRDMSPGEIVALTVRSTEFMFHCQLTSNIANRTSDGLQQLFRQQS